MQRLLLTLGLAFAAASAGAAERVARIDVSGLYCPSCSYIAGEAMKRAADGVEIVSFEEQGDGSTAVYPVRFDDAVVGAEEIAAQPAKFGYAGRLLGTKAEGS
jgi:mercuric ion binding protein